jgi:hypothetical protein
VTELADARLATDVVPGSPEALHATAAALTTRGDGLGALATSLHGLELQGVWRGSSADAFVEARDAMLQDLRFAAGADEEAATALHRYADVLESAQRNAAVAIAWWQEAESLALAVAAARRAASANHSVPGSALIDDSPEDRARAQQLLATARREVTEAARAAASALQRSQEAHEATPSWWDEVGDATMDGFRQVGNAGASLAQAMREHPDEYWETALGLLGVIGGGLGEVGGGALDVTGVGTAAGVGVNIGSAVLIGASAGAMTDGITKLANHAAGEDREAPFQPPEKEPAPGYPDADEAPQVDVRAELEKLRPGRSKPHREVDDLDELNRVFAALTRDGKPTRLNGYDGDAYELPDGTLVSMRPYSSSGEDTIDVKIPGRKLIKVHLS